MKKARMSEESYYSDPFMDLDRDHQADAMAHYEAIIGEDGYAAWKIGAQKSYRQKNRRLLLNEKMEED
jgi:hypothetical protein